MTENTGRPYEIRSMVRSMVQSMIRIVVQSMIRIVVQSMIRTRGLIMVQGMELKSESGNPGTGRNC